MKAKKAIGILAVILLLAGLAAGGVAGVDVEGRVADVHAFLGRQAEHPRAGEHRAGVWLAFRAIIRRDEPVE